MENTNKIKQDFLSLLPLKDQLDKSAEDEFISKALLKKIPGGEVLAFEGDECLYLPFVVEGIVRIYKLGETGREITLYRLNQGESCILTASCLMSKKSFPATAVAETDITILLIPSDVFRSWVKRFPYWNTYLFSLLSERLSEVIMMIEEVTFKRMDARVAEYLLNNHDEYFQVVTTHHAIARDLGSSREVVSRLLKNFEHEKIIELTRSKIKLLEKKKLSLLLKSIH